MHAIALQLAPVLAAEKSKVPFYVAGGLLVVWALTVSLGLGMRRPGFPGSLAGQRAVIAVTAVLVLAAVSSAVLTSGTPAKGSLAPTHTQELPPVPVEGAPVSASSSAGASTSTSAETSAPSSSSAPAPASSSPAHGGAASALKLAANPSGQLSYNTKLLSAKAGTVTITMTNMSPEEHNVTVAEGTKVLGATPTFQGGSRSLTLKLKPGKYVFYCSVPGHRQAGMEGTLNVS
jgi:plastocyanin